MFKKLITRKMSMSLWREKQQSGNEYAKGWPSRHSRWARMYSGLTVEELSSSSEAIHFKLVHLLRS
jgi:hypothetical protein